MLIVLLIAISVLLFRQWENIKTIYNAKTDSTEQIVRRAEESKERQRAVLEENQVWVVPPSLDQLDKLLDGKTTADELKTELGLDVPPEDVTVSPSETPPEQLAEEVLKAKAQQLIDGSTKELYAYEVDLMGQLGALKQEAIDEYRKLPEEAQTQDSKMRIGYKFLDRCKALEAESDGKVKEILNRLRVDLKALGADTGIADTLWEHYCEEKTTTKEYYLSKYL